MMSTGKIPPGFVDSLESLRLRSALGFSLEGKNFPQCQNRPARQPQQICSDVPNSDVVQNTIATVAQQRQVERRLVEADAKEILTGMAHKLSLGTIRSVAGLVKSLMESLFTHIYVNASRIEEIRAECGRKPIVFMPTHRSYLDFVLMSFLCYQYDMPMPIIAATQDFLGMKVVGEIMRRCGAFFIRRAGGHHDLLYWAVFTEYVRSQIECGDRPVEFFLEGTRSRTGKSLHPKMGLLSVLLEPIFKRQIVDVAIVPVSISYARVLEDLLYGYELLGFPKPKESTSALMRANKVLRETDLGEVFVHFGQPISCRDYFKDLLSTEYVVSTGRNLAPSAHFDWTSDERSAVEQFAYRLEQIHQRNFHLHTWSLASVVLLTRLELCSTRSISYRQLSDLVERLCAVVQRVIGDEWKFLRFKPTLVEELQHGIELHSNLVEVVDGQLTLKSPTSSVAIIDGRINPDLISTAVPLIMLSCQANPAVAQLADVSLLLNILAKNLPAEQICSEYVWLSSLFRRDFVSIPGEEQLAFTSACDKVKRAGLVDENLRLLPGYGEEVETLKMALRPYFTGYWLMAESVQLRQPSGVESCVEKSYVQSVQTLAGGMVRRTEVSPVVLSMDLIRNSLHSMVDTGVMRKEWDGRQHYYIPEMQRLRETSGKLRKYLSPSVPTLIARPKL